MRNVPGRKDGGGQGPPGKVRNVRRKRPAPLPANTVAVSHERSRAVLSDHTATKTEPLNLAKDAVSVAIPPCEWVSRLYVRYRSGTHDITQITAMEMHKKRKNKDVIKGMPHFFSVAGGEYRIYLYPVPSTDIKAEIEYKPYVK